MCSFWMAADFVPQPRRQRNPAMDQGNAREVHKLVMSDVLKGIRLDWVADGVTAKTLDELGQVRCARFRAFQSPSPQLILPSPSQLWSANLDARTRLEPNPMEALFDNVKPQFGRMKLPKKACTRCESCAWPHTPLTGVNMQKKDDDGGPARGSKKARTAPSDDDDDDDDDDGDDDDGDAPPPLAPPPVPLAKLAKAAAPKPPPRPLEDGEEALSSLSSHSSEAVQKVVVTDNLMLCQFGNVKVASRVRCASPVGRH